MGAEEAGAAGEAVKTRLEKALAGGAGGRLRLERPLETPAVSAQKIWWWDQLYPVDGDLIRRIISKRSDTRVRASGWVLLSSPSSSSPSSLLSWPYYYPSLYPRIPTGGLFRCHYS